MRCPLPGTWTIRMGTPRASTASEIFEGSDHPGGQVGRHLHRVAEADPDPAVRQLLPLELGAVRDGDQTVLHDERRSEDGLQVRLVPAGERATSVGGLEVRGADHLGVAVLVLIRAPVEAGEPGVQLPRELDAERPSSRLSGLREGHRRAFGVVVGEDLGHLDRVPVGAGQRRLIELQLVGVQDDLGDRLDDVERHLDRAGERPGVQIRLEGQVVSGGNDRPREPVSPFGVPHQSFTYVSQWTYLSFSPLVAAKNAPWSSLVTGPRWPSPTTRSSTSRIGVISAAVPVKKHSSAL